ncbi:MAG: formate dehydrogenase accessory sulfurtransferase FdhD [Planctomycetes bacterium]|nr:formate dehydrogenase accessory sulfurtransferase FdhD [Planctomycetota bacterium]
MKQDSKKLPEKLKQAIHVAKISRLTCDAPPENVSDNIVVEKPVTIMIDKVGSFTIMCTPSDIEALAVGFVYSEGIIDSIDDIVAVSMKEQLPDIVGIQVHNPTQITIKRNMIIASSCGMCGTRNIEKMLSDMSACSQSLEVSSNLLIELTERLRSMQHIFQITGGSHAAGIFNDSGKIIAFAEDLGRHSAFDKAIGKCLIAKQPTKGSGVVLSGRISLEMVTKAARAGIELIAAVSAPSSFAIEAANKWNITLCGFIRPGRTNVYTHPKRIHNLKAAN